jgi:hypothetical protein
MPGPVPLPKPSIPKPSVPTSGASKLAPKSGAPGTGDVSPKPGRVDLPSKDAVHNGINKGINMIPRSAKVAADVGIGAAVGGVPGAAVGVMANAMAMRTRMQDQHQLKKFKNQLYNSNSAIIPKAKKKIHSVTQIVIITFFVLVDITQVILDCFAVGLLVNRIIDLIVGILLAVYMAFKGMTIADNWKQYASVVLAFVAEFIPIVDVAPLWCLDAWYITHHLKSNDKSRKEALRQQATQTLTQYNMQKQQEAQQRRLALQMQAAKDYREEYPEQTPN